MKLHLACFALTLAATAAAQPYADPSSVWAGYLELKKDAIVRHVINDIPGSICVLIPVPGGCEARLVAGKVLKPDVPLPKIHAQPTPLIAQRVSKQAAANLGYLALVSASMEANDEVKFTVTETSHAYVLDSEIDWARFNARIAEIKSKNPGLPPGTLFGTVRVANVIAISYQTFSKVSSAAKIAGWGFSGGGSYLSEKSDESHDFKVGVSLAYPDVQFDGIFQMPAFKLLNAHSNPEKFHQIQSMATNNLLVAALQAPAEWLDSDEEIMPSLAPAE